MTHRLVQSLLVLASLGLSGCAAFSPDSGMNAVSELTGQTINKDVAFVRTAEGAGAVDARVRQLLSRTLTPETAVQIALLNNKGLQAAYNELALAETDLVEQSLPPNPVFSVSRISGNGASEIERQIVGDILALATLPFARRSPATVFARRNCALAWQRCGLLQTSAASIGAPLAATRWWRC